MRVEGHLSREERVQMVREHLMAAIAKDVSIAISLFELDEYQSPCSSLPWPLDGHEGTIGVTFDPDSGRRFLYRASILDTSLKRADKIPEWLQLEREIASYASSQPSAP